MAWGLRTAALTHPSSLKREAGQHEFSFSWALQTLTAEPWVRILAAAIVLDFGVQEGNIHAISFCFFLPQVPVSIRCYQQDTGGLCSTGPPCFSYALSSDW